MPRPLTCRFCRCDLDPAREFAYLVELQTTDNPVMLDAIRRLPHAAGKPVRVCRRCEPTVTGAPVGRRRTPVVTALAVVGIVAVGASLGRWLVARSA